MGTVIPLLSQVRGEEIGPGCEPLATGFLREPVSAWSSFAFVAAGVLIVLLGRRRRRLLGTAPGTARALEPSSVAYAVLVAGIGLGSVAQHGPNPPWADLAHDLPLLGTLAFITADAVADLAGRARVWWWWALPTAVLAPVIHWFPQEGDMAQGAVAVVTVLVSVFRAYRRPALRRTIGWTVVVLASGGTLEILSSPGWPLCAPESLWYGHAAWHVLVAAGLTVLAAALGWRGPAGTAGVSATPPAGASAPASDTSPVSATGRAARRAAPARASRRPSR